VVFAASANPDLPDAAEMRHQIGAVFIGAALMNVAGLILTALFILPANRSAPGRSGAMPIAVSMD